jgi:hypothetical protein
VKLNDIGLQIATRELQVNGKKVTVVIGRPEKFPDGQDYFCPYQILGMGDEKVSYAGGVDAVQSLQLALKKIGTDLYTSTEYRTKQLCWDGSDSGELGFPVPDSIRDLAPGLSGL